MTDTPVTLPKALTMPEALTMPAPTTPLALPTPSSPSDLLLRRNQALVAKLIATHYGEHLHAWLIAKGEKAFAPFSGSMTWEHFRITIAPYLCSMEMPHASMRIPFPCRKIGQDPRRWMNVSLKEAKRGGFYWRNKIAMKQWVDPHAIARLGEGMQLLASVSVDPLIGGMGRGVGYRDLVGKEVAWNEGVEDESMWNESEEEGDDEGKTGGKRWFLHEKTETKEERRMRLAMDENEDEDMETDDELELLGEDDSEWSQAEKSGGPDSELEMSEWGKSDDDFLAAAGF